MDTTASGINDGGDTPLRVAIVGSGPGGFYAAEALLASGLAVEVDLIERLPVPYGLVRFGVAPDHAKLKSVTAVFAQIAQDPRLRFFGNVSLGRDVSAAELARMYHAVIVATGADGDRKLGIDGEALAGVHAARDFVGWYNGAPDCAALEFDLSHEVAVVVGQGNVAIDVCRILARPVDALRRTDIAQHALDALAASRVRHIHLVGRRGPVQAKFTPKELRELGTLPGWQPLVDPAALELNPASAAELALPACAQAAKNVDILRAFAARPREAERAIQLHFLHAPAALHGDARVRGITLDTQRLAGPPGAQTAEADGGRVSLDCGLVLRSVGYRGSALPGLPFDARAGVLPNDAGRLTGAAGSPLPGWYVTGWIKRGPGGVIGTNRADSVETVDTLLRDVASLRGDKPGRRALRAALEQRGHRVIDLAGWLAIERAERARGEALDKPMDKFVRIDDMLAAAAGRADAACGLRPSAPA
ncbi:MAG: FAD-dependent oxidoreductase [Gammaproteobacteria bacterium]|jgi:ferredoxin/flavodoxin---NADP+ reductase|nr:FAD-dependent oxidoreductase [Gammaproteobacteria bacterium]MBU0856303.1 FAD-dependent oxidoreductase [Gammaproteobacteria bacterium]MBU1847744.1 FAD-dependent oxidoreductase [Gammaproteobacteria bacterium]